jgi:hypothetical protein
MASQYYRVAFTVGDHSYITYAHVAKAEDAEAAARQNLPKARQETAVLTGLTKYQAEETALDT